MTIIIIIDDDDDDRHHRHHHHHHHQHHHHLFCSVTLVSRNPAAGLKCWPTRASLAKGTQCPSTSSPVAASAGAPPPALEGPRRDPQRCASHRPAPPPHTRREEDAPCTTQRIRSRKLCPRRRLLTPPRGLSKHSILRPRPTPSNAASPAPSLLRFP